jgi:hypothetical protein
MPKVELQVDEGDKKTYEVSVREVTESGGGGGGGGSTGCLIIIIAGLLSAASAAVAYAMF